MSSVNQGGQKIGWKYSTPLVADELNTFIAGLTSPGLVTRCSFEWQSSSTSSTMVSISPLSLFIVPLDKEKGNEKSFSLIKVTTTSTVTLTVDKGHCAIGFEFSFTETGVPQSQWFGNFKPLTPQDAKDFKGVIIATVQSYEHDGTVNFSITDKGADISDCLLLQEGWDPCCWLSVISPRRMDSEFLNKLEVRRHNDAYTGYINGIKGCVRIENPVYSIPTDPLVDKNGTRGTNMPNKYNLFNLSTNPENNGLTLCNSGAVFPIEGTNGGIFAMVDASNSMDGGSGPVVERAFINQFIIEPVAKEDLNIWFDDTNGTLYINTSK